MQSEHDLRARGSRHGGAKLTEDVVREIRRRYADDHQTFDALARTFGVSPQTISLVIHRRTWRHVQP